MLNILRSNVDIKSITPYYSKYTSARHRNEEREHVGHVGNSYKVNEEYVEGG